MKGSSATNAQFAEGMTESSKVVNEPVFVSEKIANSVENEMEEKNPNLFYISLLLNGQKLSNCIIDFGASDNTMPKPVEKSLDLELTKTFGCCYSMDGKKVPPVGQVKDVQAILYAYLEKRLKLTILIADIPTNYGMLLNRTFCKDMGGEIKMDWSEVYIPVGKKKIKIEPKPKNKYTIVPSDNPKAHILYKECQFGNYVIFLEEQYKGSEIVSCEEALWTLEFNGSCLSLGLGVDVVLISPSGDIFPFSFKLDFHNTNNTTKYETLLLGLQEAKVKGVK